MALYRLQVGQRELWTWFAAATRKSRPRRWPEISMHYPAELRFGRHTSELEEWNAIVASALRLLTPTF